MTEEKEIEAILERAYKKFLVNESYLLDTNANERTMTHKYAEYIQQEFPSWHVDCEYNRAKDDNGLDIPKAVYSLADHINDYSRVFPDIIVHHRGTSDNFIVIEAKKSGANKHDIEYDKLKLRGYLNEHKYKYGFLLTFSIKASTPDNSILEQINL